MKGANALSEGTGEMKTMGSLWRASSDTGAMRQQGGNITVATTMLQSVYVKMEARRQHYNNNTAMPSKMRGHAAASE